MVSKIKTNLKAIALLGVFLACPADIMLAQEVTPLQDIRSLDRSFQQPGELLPKSKGASTKTNGTRANTEKKYILNGVTLHGATVFPEETLAPLWQERIGTAVSVATLTDIANALGAHYRNSGYFLTSVYPQVRRAASGGNGIELHLAVVEGYVDRIDIASEEGSKPDRKRIESYVRPVFSSRPLQIETLERALLLANDMPGMTAKSVIRPSATTPGAASVVIVTEQDPWSGELYATNRVSGGYGPLSLSGRLTFNFGSNQARVSFAGAQDFIDDAGGFGYLNLQYRRLVGSNGGAVEASVSASRPQQSLDPLPGVSEGETLSGSLRFTHPFLRTRKNSVYGFVGVRGDSQSSKILGSTTMDENIWSVNAGVTAQLRRPGHTTQMSFEIAKGLGILGASQPNDTALSRVGGRPDFLLFSGEISHLRSLGSGFLGLANAGFQYSPDTLLSGQEFALVGSRFAKGYVDEQLLGDSGIGLGFELSRPLEMKGFRQFVPYAYVDGGWVWKHGVGTQSLASTGVGVRTWFENNVNVDLSVNTPLGNNALETVEKDWLLIATVGWQF